MNGVLFTDQIFGEREESLNNLWLFIVINTTVLAILINIVSLHYGQNDVAPNLFYIPVVIAAYWYPHRGPVFAVIISLCYMALVYIFLGSDIAMLMAASVICYVQIGVSIVVSSLAAHMRRNEVKYRSLFNHSQAGVGLVHRASLRTREVNARFTEILGYTGEDVLQVPFSDLFVDGEKREAFFRQLDREKDIWSFEARFHAKSGDILWVHISAGMMPENNFVVTIIDITERKNVELALLIKDHAISSSINAIAILDLDFHITYVNESFIRLMDYPSKLELVGRNVAAFLNIPGQFESVKEAVGMYASWFGEIELVSFHKRRFFVQLSINKVRDDDGNPICIMASFIDITDRKQVEMAKRSALRQVEKNIEQFAILGDHIRNPLAVIVGLSSLTPSDMSDKILFQAKEIDRIITQLDMGWIESDKVRDFIKKYYEYGLEDDTAVEQSARDESTGHA
jgi:PAS domain S-box-containing protein